MCTLLGDYQMILDRYPNHTPVYTDGSKIEETVAAAAVCGRQQSAARLPDRSSIFSAELTAINLAFDIIRSSQETNFIIFTDSLSSLQAIAGKKIENPLILDLIEKFTNLNSSKNILFCWLPSHMGIIGNEKADKAAKDALILQPSNLKVPFTDFKQSINSHIKDSWQSSWNNAIGNKLYDIKPTLGDCPTTGRVSRREEIVLARCRIGHSRFTHSYLFDKSEQPECIPCSVPLTIKHILLDCVDTQIYRSKYFNVPSMRQLFETVSVDKILDFLREISIYHKT